MIKFQNVTKIYQENIIVLQDVSFEIKEGEFVSIVGKSGAGKTTLIRMILGLEFPTYGEVFFDGESVSKANSKILQKIRRKIGSVYQDYRLLPAKTVYENVAYIMEVEGKENEEIEVEVPRVLEIIGLGDKMNNFPRELSGGEQQRLSIARALSGKTVVLSTHNREIVNKLGKRVITIENGIIIRDEEKGRFII
ncbi:MAG: Cell division ATP-binding protein FtsE [Parcubacteria group bacterium GW2011_GWA2_33_14]|nr:MAG: Cell division ATP-binding protein FtsE [Parcubacteria group bacterium GW2011_GWA2_33_14]